MKDKIKNAFGSLIGWGLLVLSSLLVLCGITWAAQQLARMVLGL